MLRPVLLVEDEILLREATREDLCDLGYDPVCASRADEAWEILKNDTPLDALITDIRMPGDWDGWELARQARALRPKLGVIYVSGYSDAQAQPVEGAVYLKKPYRFDDIRVALEQVAATS